MDLYATFLLARLWMSPDSFEKQIGEERYGRRVDDLQPFHPFWSLSAPAVRGKQITVSSV